MIAGLALALLLVSAPPPSEPARPPQHEERSVMLRPSALQDLAALRDTLRQDVCQDRPVVAFGLLWDPAVPGGVEVFVWCGGGPER